MTKTSSDPTHIEVVQVVTKGGDVAGYDHRRSNFIVWGIDVATDRIVVQRVEHDEQAEANGSLDATRRDAAAVAARHNRLPASRLRAAIVRQSR